MEPGRIEPPAAAPPAPQSPYSRYWRRLVRQKREIMVLVNALNAADAWTGRVALLRQRMIGLAEYSAGLTAVLEWLERAGRAADPPVRRIGELSNLAAIGRELRALVLGAVPEERRAAVFMALAMVHVPRREVYDIVRNCRKTTRRRRPEREVPGLRRTGKALAVAYGIRPTPRKKKRAPSR